MNGLSLLCETWSWSLECYMPVSNWELGLFSGEFPPFHLFVHPQASLQTRLWDGPFDFWLVPYTASVQWFIYQEALTCPFCQINASLSHLQPPYPVQAVGRSCNLCWVMETKWVSPPRNLFCPSWENPTMQIACRFLSDLPLKVQRLGC